MKLEKSFFAYKGFDKDLVTNKFQFAVGETYVKEDVLNPRLCSSDGFHYCNKLEQVFSFHANNGSNRFCEVEILGNYTEDSNKSITTKIKIVKEISKQELLEVQKLKDEITLEKNLHIETVKDILAKYPHFIIGGSVGLYLHGIRLERWKKNGLADIDIISPYFTRIEGDSNLQVGEECDELPSGADFDVQSYVNSIKTEIYIDPKSRYDIIEHKGFRYKVNTLENIWAAKLKYSKNNKKHSLDLRETMNLK